MLLHLRVFLYFLTSFFLFQEKQAWDGRNSERDLRLPFISAAVLLLAHLLPLRAAWGWAEPWVAFLIPHTIPGAQGCLYSGKLAS